MLPSINEYLGILIMAIISIALGIIIISLSVIVAPSDKTSEKSQAYECGFDSFEDARDTFDVRFFRVAVLFLIFDLELSFLMPWVLILSELSLNSFIYMVLFLFILTLGFIYEFKKGALDW